MTGAYSRNAMFATLLPDIALDSADRMATEKYKHSVYREIRENVASRPFDIINKAIDGRDSLEIARLFNRFLTQRAGWLWRP